jgi:hypothetical protein
VVEVLVSPTDASRPLIRDPGPLADSLVRYMDEPMNVQTVLAIAVRAALAECAEEQQVALNGLDITNSDLTKSLLLGRIETANRVVHRVTEALDYLAEVKDDDRLTRALRDAVTVLRYVSAGRGYVDVEPYPDALARRALGALDDAGLLTEEVAVKLQAFATYAAQLMVARMEKIR